MSKFLEGGGSPHLYYHDGNNVPGHTTRAPPVGFEPETNGIQFYAIANLDRTSLDQGPHDKGAVLRSEDSEERVTGRAAVNLTLARAMALQNWKFTNLLNFQYELLIRQANHSTVKYHYDHKPSLSW